MPEKVYKIKVILGKFQLKKILPYKRVFWGGIVVLRDLEAV
jgi:hypothetical protein